jgi:hypothetical protein
LSSSSFLWLALTSAGTKVRCLVNGGKCNGELDTAQALKF